MFCIALCVAVDGIHVKMAEIYDMAGIMAKCDLVQKMDLLSIEDIQKKVCATHSGGLLSIACWVLWLCLGIACF